MGERENDSLGLEGKSWLIIRLSSSFENGCSWLFIHSFFSVVVGGFSQPSINPFLLLLLLSAYNSLDFYKDFECYFFMFFNIFYLNKYFFPFVLYFFYNIFVAVVVFLFNIFYILIENNVLFYNRGFYTLSILFVLYKLFSINNYLSYLCFIGGFSLETKRKSI